MHGIDGRELKRNHSQAMATEKKTPRETNGTHGSTTYR